jgi:hypothetical protein
MPSNTFEGHFMLNHLGPTLLMLREIGQIADAVNYALLTDSALDIRKPLERFAQHMQQYCRGVGGDIKALSNIRYTRTFNTIEFGVKDLAKSVASLTGLRDLTMNKTYALFLEISEKAGYTRDQVEVLV